MGETLPPSASSTTRKRRRGDSKDLSSLPSDPVDSFDKLICLARQIDDIICTHTATKKKTFGRQYYTLKNLSNILPELEEIHDLIGLTELKDQIAMQLVFLTQNLTEDEYLNIAIMGPPGVGKTTIVNILAKIFSKIGHLEHGDVTVAKRTDCIGQYLGETAIKTTDLLNRAKGGVLLIDEAYQLGSNPNSSSGDSYSRECMNTLNQFIGENPNDIVCIIAGYKEEIYKSFFKANPGLERRFPWKFEVKPYTPKELNKVFLFQLSESQWKLEEGVDLTRIISNNKELFEFNGGDTKSLLDKCKMIYAQRVLMLPDKEKTKVITQYDIDTALKRHKLNKELNAPPAPPSSMYL